MSSPGQASNYSSRQTSVAPSSSSSYLSVPSTSARPQQGTAGPQMLLSRSAKPSSAYVSPYPPVSAQNAASSPGKPIDVGAIRRGTTTTTTTSSSSAQLWHSAATASQEESEAAQKQALIDALNEHRVNTIGELRRVERVFATLGSSDLTQPMTAAWMYYVNSYSLLTELRALTRNYPFSSECLDEAKRRVYQDPASNRSWNLAWLVLAKIQTDKLIPAYARAQASRPEMWGGRSPTPQNVEQLATAFVQEWNAAVVQLLRYWEAPPIKPAGER